MRKYSAAPSLVNAFMGLCREQGALEWKNTLIKTLSHRPNESADNEAGKRPAGPEISLDKFFCVIGQFWQVTHERKKIKGFLQYQTDPEAKMKRK